MILSGIPPITFTSVFLHKVMEIDFGIYVNGIRNHLPYAGLEIRYIHPMPGPKGVYVRQTRSPAQVVSPTGFTARSPQPQQPRPAFQVVRRNASSPQQPHPGMWPNANLASPPPPSSQGPGWHQYFRPTPVSPTMQRYPPPPPHHQPQQSHPQTHPQPYPVYSSPPISNVSQNAL
nr:uncharacterized protein LOC129274006 [Lytechinus pictus]